MVQVLSQLRLADWNTTRDTLHQYARIIGKIRRRYMPKSKHWWHITLSVSTRGMTTTPFPVEGQNIELTLDLAEHVLSIHSSLGWETNFPLAGQSPRGICQQITASLATAGIKLDADLLADFSSEDTFFYDAMWVNCFRQTINWIDAAFKDFKGSLREETSPVQIFPHHMDISMNWFSGRLVPGVDPADEESADEQMNFGFVTGDDSISDAYFYVTAYPLPEKMTELTLPTGAYWHTEGWTGAILPYATVVASEQPYDLLLTFLQDLQSHGKQLMT